jgi:hypothetical protein
VSGVRYPKAILLCLPPSSLDLSSTGYIMIIEPLGDPDERIGQHSVGQTIVGRDVGLCQ